MADISMCRNQDCPLSESCYRVQAKPNEFRQAYSVFEFKSTMYKGVECDGYTPVHKKHGADK